MDDFDRFAKCVAEALSDDHRHLVRREFREAATWIPSELEARYEHFDEARKRVPDWFDFDEEQTTDTDDIAWAVRAYRNEVKAIASCMKSAKLSEGSGRPIPLDEDWVCDWETIASWRGAITPIRYRRRRVYHITPPRDFGAADDPPVITSMSVHRFIERATDCAGYDSARAQRLESELRAMEQKYYLANGVLISLVLMVLIMLFS